MGKWRGDEEKKTSCKWPFMISPTRQKQGPYRLLTTRSQPPSALSLIASAFALASPRRARHLSFRTLRQRGPDTLAAKWCPHARTQPCIELAVCCWAPRKNKTGSCAPRTPVRPSQTVILDMARCFDASRPTASTRPVSSVMGHARPRPRRPDEAGG